MSPDDTRSPADPSAPIGAGETTIVELGAPGRPRLEPAGAPGPDPPWTDRLRWGGSGLSDAARLGGTRLGEWVAAARDRWLVPVTAGLGSVAIAGSLVADWAVVVYSPDLAIIDDGPFETTVTIADLGAFGAAYLIGLLALTVGVVLVFAGSPEIRQNTRVGTIALGTGLLVVLVAAAASFDRFATRAVAGSELEFRLEYGRGLGAAFLGVAGLVLTMHLAGRLALAASRAGEFRGESAGDEDGPVDWPWRRPRRTADPDPTEGYSGPADLSVTPAPPFVESPASDSSRTP